MIRATFSASIFPFLLLLGGVLFQLPTFGQSTQRPTVFTDDIDRFWEAFDSARTTADEQRQHHFFQTLYIDRASPGLREFLKARDYDATLYTKLFRQYPRFWQSVRPNTLSIKNRKAELEVSVQRFRQLYPALQDAQLYFTIGGLRSGGTTSGKLVLVGAEIAAADAQTDVSEFTDKWLPNVFRSQSADNFVYLNIHEYVHTQQRGEGKTLLAKALAEGSCDFIAELVIDKPLNRDYITYGRAHLAELRDKFKREMFAPSHVDWLGNGSNALTVADLGYFMGYDICRAYYQQASDKEAAVRTIIELNHQDQKAVEHFLQQSGYFPEGFDKKQLLRDYNEKQPRIVTLTPFANGNRRVDPALTEIGITFSTPMASGISINMGKGGKELFPLQEVIGFTPDNRTLRLRVKLQPAHDYEFVLTNRRFRSADGLPLSEEQHIRFRTR